MGRPVALRGDQEGPALRLGSTAAGVEARSTTTGVQSLDHNRQGATAWVAGPATDRGDVTSLLPELAGSLPSAPGPAVAGSRRALFGRGHVALDVTALAKELAEAVDRLQSSFDEAHHGGELLPLRWGPLEPGMGSGLGEIGRSRTKKGQVVGLRLRSGPALLERPAVRAARPRAKGDPRLAGGGDLGDFLRTVPTGWLGVLGDGEIREDDDNETTGELVATAAPGRRRSPGPGAGGGMGSPQDLYAWLEEVVPLYCGLMGWARRAGGDGSSPVRALLAAQRIVPLLDGLDEIPPELRRKAVHQLNSVFRGHTPHPAWYLHAERTSSKRRSVHSVTRSCSMASPSSSSSR